MTYTVMYLQASEWAFPVAALGAVLFSGICWRKRMFAEAALWVFYLGYAVYGMVATHGEWPEPVHAGWGAHAVSLLVISVGTWALARGLRRWGERTAVGLDAFTTVGSIVATHWMLAFDPVNWWYWMVIDAAAIALYWRNGLRWGATLFAVYLLLAVEGWFDVLTWP
jgi:nicotinamide mononucleotide transporter